MEHPQGCPLARLGKGGEYCAEPNAKLLPSLESDRTRFGFRNVLGLGTGWAMAGQITKQPSPLFDHDGETAKHQHL